MRKLLLVFAIIAIVACADLNQELNNLVDELKLEGFSFRKIWKAIKKVACVVGAPVCCAVSSNWCNTCKGASSALCS